MDGYTVSVIIISLSVVIGIYCGLTDWFDRLMRNIGELLRK